MSNQNLNLNRVAAGVPRGGQFAAGQRPESSVSLEPEAPQIDTAKSGLAALVAEIRAAQASRDAELEQLSGDAERSGNYGYYDELAADCNEAAAADLDRLLDYLEQHGASAASPDSGQIDYSGQETRIEGGFGEVIVSPRDPDSGPGTIVMVDTSGATEGQPLVVMVNDEIIEVPVEGLSPSETCADCGRHVDACICLDRDVDEDTPVRKIDELLQRAYVDSAANGPSGEMMVQKLSAHAAARIFADADPDAKFVDLDWGPSGGLEPIATRASADGPSSSLDLEAAADAAIYTSNFRGDFLSRSGTMWATGNNAHPYRLDIDRALGRTDDAS